MYFALAENESKISQYVSIFFALGPVMELAHIKSNLLDFLAENYELVVDTCEMLGVYDLFPENYLDDLAMQLLCGYIPELCEFGVSLICDEDPSLDDSTRLEDYVGGHFPSGTSLFCLAHYAQLVKS